MNIRKFINELIRTAKQEIKSYLPEEKRMWSREGADLLLTLSRTANMSDKAALAISKFGAVTAASAPEPVEDGAK